MYAKDKIPIFNFFKNIKYIIIHLDTLPSENAQSL